jgi:hypothetical protein
MFFSLFWTAYIPVGMVILSLAGEQLIHSFRRLRGPALDCLFEPTPNQARAHRRVLK